MRQPSASRRAIAVEGMQFNYVMPERKPFFAQSLCAKCSLRCLRAMLFCTQVRSELCGVPKQPPIIQTNQNAFKRALAGRRRPRRFERTNNELRSEAMGQVMDTRAVSRRWRREAAKLHQTRRWRSSRTVRDHGDYRAQRTSSKRMRWSRITANAAGNANNHK